MNLVARDVRDLIVTSLNDVTNGLKAQLAIIDAYRGETTPTPKVIKPQYDQGQYPQVFVDLGDSTINPALGSTIDNLTEIIETSVSAALKDGSQPKVEYWGENYIEAIIRCLASYKYQVNNGSFYCVPKKVLRADLDSQQNMSLRGVAVIFDTYRNSL